MHYYYHPESGSLWGQSEPLTKHDGLVEEISKDEYEQQLTRRKQTMMLNFDATKFDPDQGMPKHPTGKFPAIISNVSVEENKNKDGGYFQVTFTTQSGQINKNYNLWFTNPSDGQKQSMEIAQRQLSALCHAVGIFRLGDGKELINARLQIEVTPQNKNPQYNEVSKIYNAAGNEPGKATPAPQPAQQGQGGWTNAAPQQPVQQPQQAAPANGGWQPQTAPVTTAPGPQPGPITWQQGPSATPSGAPAWAQNK